jgi:predicted permease
MAFHVPTMITVVITLTQAMPAGSLPVVFAEQYGRNSKLGAELVFISTLLSMITIPVACILLTQYMNL